MSAEYENANELVFVSNASQMKLARSMDVEAPSTEYLRNLPECAADYSICQGMIADCSTTKHVDGQGRMLGGAICGPTALIRGPIEAYMKHTGGAMNPFAAWTHLKAMETLELRVRAQADTVMKLADGLMGHPALQALRYPTHQAHPQQALALSQAPAAGTVFTIEVKGGKAACFRFLNALELFTISNNFADAKSIATHPATTTHQRLPQAQKDLLGISDGLVRLSVGLEDADDLLADLVQALERV